MLNRIKWEEDVVKGKEDDETENKCSLIWEVRDVGELAEVRSALITFWWINFLKPTFPSCCVY